MIALHKKQKRGRAAIREQRAAYLFLIPAFLGLSLITYIPLLAAFFISFTDLNTGHFVQGGTLPPVQFVGLSNYIDIFINPSIHFMNSIQVTLYYTLLAVVGSIIYSMIIALLLNRKIPGRSALRAIYYIPYILPATAVMITWWFLLRFDGGVVNYALTQLGLGKSYFLGRANTAIPTLAMIAIWGCGNLIVIFLAGLQNVPRVYHEAAEIDGANSWQRLWNVTMPCMTPIIFFNLMMSVVANLQVVVPALAITKGGPGNSTMFMTYLMYQTGFRRRELGKAGAIAFVFFVVAAILAAILFATSKSWIFNEGGDDK
ncbi:MAG: sugar ABC transporter permease [Clostridia bacterium]|nr:sugar ABC transporter permease [Clostridia bacterium]